MSKESKPAVDKAIEDVETFIDEVKEECLLTEE